MKLTQQLEKLMEEKGKQHCTIMDPIWHNNVLCKTEYEGYKAGFKAALDLEVLAQVPEVKALYLLLQEFVNSCEYYTEEEMVAQDTLAPWDKYLGGKGE